MELFQVIGLISALAWSFFLISVYIAYRNSMTATKTIKLLVGLNVVVTVAFFLLERILDPIYWLLIAPLFWWLLFLFFIYLRYKTKITKTKMLQLLAGLNIAATVIVFFFWRWLDFAINNHVYPGK